MKKLILIVCLLFSFVACSDEDNNGLVHVTIPVDEALVPESFDYLEENQITISYTLPNNCFSSSELFYQESGQQRYIAVTSIENLNQECSGSSRKLTLTFNIRATQTEDYILKFWKGFDETTGEDLYAEYVVPVENVDQSL